MKQIRMNSGYTIPQVGLGTWMIKGDECTRIVQEAIKKGYTHIDTALRYENHKAIAPAIKNVKRTELYITSKIWRDRLDYNGVLEQVYTILEELETEYIDLCLIHWPNKDFDMKDTFEALEELVNEGSIRSIGVSNFTINHLKKAIQVSNIPISVNQVEFHYKLYQKELFEFCKKNNITLEAYSPLVHGEFIGDENIEKFATKYNKSTSQIILRWLIEKDIVVLPKTSNVNRLDENKDIFDFELSKEDHKFIDSLNEDKRVINPPFAEFNR